MAAQPLDLTGDRYGRLVALHPTPARIRRSVVWAFACDCGNRVELASGEVRTGKVRSCGCLKTEALSDNGRRAQPIAAAATKTHGKTKTPTFTVWVNMIQRCTNTNHKSYPRYGGRGIAVCHRWLDSFEAFLADMGERPPGAQLDRRNNDLGYEPGNCWWVDPITNGNNRSNNRLVTHGSRTQTISQWARATGLRKATIRHRLDAGWPVAEALETAPDRANRTFRKV